MRLVLGSDRHLQPAYVPEGDVYVEAGDMTFRGNVEETNKAIKYYVELKKRFKEVVLIAGNHDWLFEKNPTLARLLMKEAGLTYLEDSGIEIDGVSFYGSPWQPEFNSWAFNLSRFDGSLAETWDKIPEGIDVLITHGPPQNILDETAGYHEVTYARERYTPPEHVGCYDLAQRVKIVKPKVHVFGHIHHSYGSLVKDGTIFLNASVCNEKYKPVNPPFIVDIIDGKATLVDWVAQKEVEEIEKTLPKEWL